MTADHETGGLDTFFNNGAGNLPAVSWSTGGHTQTSVPVFSKGPAQHASKVQGVIDNTDIFYILTATEPISRTVTEVFQQGLNGYNGSVDTYVQEASPAANHANVTTLNVDMDDPSGSSQSVQTLLWFGDLFGDETGQIPITANIQSATLQLELFNVGDAIDVHHRVHKPWPDCV